MATSLSAEPQSSSACSKRSVNDWRVTQKDGKIVLALNVAAGSIADLNVDLSAQSLRVEDTSGTQSIDLPFSVDPASCIVEFRAKKRELHVALVEPRSSEVSSAGPPLFRSPSITPSVAATKVESTSVGNGTEGTSDADRAAQQTWEAIKEAGAALYRADDYEGAIEKYGEAIDALETLAGDDDPEDVTLRKALSVLLTNRAMCRLLIVKRTQEGKKILPGAQLPAELRPLVMRANVDASRAADLDERNAKAWLRKGQALLWMGALQQRAKEAVKALEQAHDCPGLTAGVKPEVDKWLSVAKEAFDGQTPSACPTM